MSKIATKLFEEIQEFLSDRKLMFGNDEHLVWCRPTKKMVRVDCFDRDTQRIIEFFGDYWHASPKMFQEHEVIKDKSVKEIWERDNARIKNLEASGYDVLVVWEDEYVNNPTLTKMLCISFLAGESVER